jgi:hypothetical protein
MAEICILGIPHRKFFHLINFGREKELGMVATWKITTSLRERFDEINLVVLADHSYFICNGALIRFFTFIWSKEDGFVYLAP